ncbi:uncharacterized protein LOC141881320 [Acropora palmata]|uniref:uncharacterized protein LOC141881320 n=1 Tax=Acropora palmata TaxID=6131 RepID=UPI003DA00B41
MNVDEKVNEKTAWAGEPLSEASEMDSFRREQEEISYAEGNEAIEEDRGLKETAEKTQDGQSLLGGEVLEVGSTMQPGDDTKVLDLKPVEACERECRSECTTCSRLKNEISHLKGKITKLKYKLANNQEQWVQTFHQIQEQNRLLMVNTAVQTDPVVSEDQPTEEDLEVNEEDEEDEEDEEANIPDFFDQDPTWDPETIDSEYDKIRNEDDSANTYDNPR